LEDGDFSPGYQAPSNKYPYDEMQQVLLPAPEIHCDHCKMSIEGAVGALEGVSSVEVAIADATVDVTYDEATTDLDAIKHTIEEQGYAVFG
jgi:copper chaperone